MDRTLLQAELKELHRGRGVRRTEVRSWLGPRLKGILGVNAAMSDDDARHALVQLIRDHTASFPRDLRYLFLVGTGIVVDQPFLEDRLTVAEQALDRSARVLRRRLRTAEQLLADALVQAYPKGTGPFEDQGWQWEDHDFHLVLRDNAVLTLSRTLKALADHQKFIHESFVIPGTLAPESGLTFTAVDGFSVLDVDHSTPNSWGVTLQLPKTLTRGQSLHTTLTVEIPDARVLNPFMVLAPVRACRRAVVTVDFGTPPVAASGWLIDGALPSDLSFRSSPPDAVDPESSPVISGTFLAPRPGLAYGIGWIWTD